MSTMLESLQLERGQSVTEPVPLWIGGKPRPSVNGDIRADTSPSTGDLLADVHYAGAADIDEAVLAAKVAQPIWALDVDHGARRPVDRAGPACAGSCERVRHVWTPATAERRSSP